MKLRLPKLLKAALLACITAAWAFTLGTASAADRTTAATSGAWSTGATGVFGAAWVNSDTARFTSPTGGGFTLGSNIVAASTVFAGRVAGGDVAGNAIPWLFDLSGHTLDFGAVTLNNGGKENSPITIKGGAATMASYTTGGAHQTWFTIEGVNASLTITGNFNSAFLNKKGLGVLKIGGNVTLEGADNQFLISGGGTVEVVGKVMGGKTGNFATITGGSSLILHSDFGVAGSVRNIIFDDAAVGNILQLDSTGGQTSDGMTVYGNVFAVDAAVKNGILVNVAGANRITGGFRFGATEGAGSVQVQTGTLTIDGDITATGAYGFNASVAENAHLVVNNIQGAAGKLNAASKIGAGKMTLKGLYSGAEAFALGGGILITQGNGALGTAGNISNITVASGAELNVRNAVTLGAVTNDGNISVSHQGVLTINPTTVLTGISASNITVTGGTLKLVAGVNNPLSFTGNMNVGGTSSEANPLFFFDMTGYTGAHPLLRISGALNWNVTGAQYFGIDFGVITPAENATYTLIQGDTLNQGSGASTSFIIPTNGFLYTYTVANSALTLTVTKGTRTTLTWTGGTGRWEEGIAGEAHWADDGNQGFLIGDAVVFDETGGGGQINLVGALYPRELIVKGAQDYTFIGTGKIGGDIGITKEGTGTLTINTVNTFNGVVHLKGGTLIAGNASALGTGKGGIMGGGTSTLDLSQVAGGLSTSSINTVAGATLTILGNLKLANFDGTFNAGGGTINLGDSSTLTLSAIAQAGGRTNVTLKNLSGTGTISYSAGSASAENTLTLDNVALGIDIQLVSGRIANYRGSAITLNSNSTAANASLSYSSATGAEYSATVDVRLGAGGGAIIVNQALRFLGNITAVPGTSGNLELSMPENNDGFRMSMSMLGTLKMGGALKVLDGGGVLTLDSNDAGSNSFEIGSLELGSSARLVINTNNLTIKGNITMGAGSSIAARGAAREFGTTNLTTMASDDKDYNLDGGAGLSFNQLNTGRGVTNQTFSILNITGAVSFKTTAIGGWGLTTNVGNNATLNLGSISFGNNGVGFRKNGAGTMVITNITSAANTHKALTINAGQVEFRFDAGISAGYNAVIAGAGILKKSGEGTLTLAGANTFTGGIILQGGTLRAADGALGAVGSRNIQIWGNTVLQSSAIGGSMAIDSLQLWGGTSLSLGGVGIMQAITAQNVALGAASVLRFDLRSPEEQDILTVAQTLNLQGAGIVIQLDLGPLLSISGTILEKTLINAAAATITGDLGNISIDQTSLNRGITATSGWVEQFFKVWLVGQTLNVTSTWNGGAGTDHRWVAGGLGWTGSNEKNYKNGDSVVFSAVPEGGAALVGNVILVGSLTPKNILVTGGNYTFGGDGSISGVGSLTLQGNSQLGINTINSYSGGTVLEGTSHLVLGVQGALGSGSLTVKGTSALDTSALATGYNLAGDFVLDVGAALTLTGSMTLAKVNNLGTMNVAGGQLSVNGAFTGGATSAFHLSNSAQLSFSILNAAGSFATKISSASTARVIFNVVNTTVDLLFQPETDFTGFSGEIEFRAPGKAHLLLSAKTFSSVNNSNITFVMKGVTSFRENNGNIDTNIVRNMNFLFTGTSADGTDSNMGQIQVWQNNLTYAGNFTVVKDSSARFGSSSIASPTTTITGNILGEGVLQFSRGGGNDAHTFYLSGNNTISKIVLGGGTNLGADIGGRKALVYAKSANALGKHVVFSNNNSELFVDFSKVTVEDISSFAAGTNKINIMGTNTFEVNTKVATSIFHGVIRNGALTGDAGILQKSGTGTLTLAGVNTYSGGTIISAGTLALTGAGTLGTGEVKLQGTSINALATLNLNSANIGNKIVVSDGMFGTITGWNTASLAQVGIGSGATYVGNLNLGSGQKLNVFGATGAVAAVSGNLALNGSVLNFVLGASTLDSLTVGGVLTVTAKSTINIELGSAALTQGAYQLVSTSSAFSADFLSNFFLTGVVTTGRRGYKLSIGNGAAGSSSGIYLTVTGGEAKNLTWSGTTGHMSWNGLEINKNWSDPSIVESNKSQFYMDGDTVEFTIAGAGTVDVAALGVAPKAMNITGGSYTFTGGAIKGGALSVTGGSLILANNNTSEGTLTIAAGAFTVQLGNNSAAGDWKGNISIGAGASLITNRSDAALTLSKIITGDGQFIQRGTGGVTIHSDLLTGATSSASFTGGTTVEAGILNLGTGTAGAIGSARFGSGAITLTGGQVNLKLTSGGGANSYTFTNHWAVTGDATIAYASGGDRNTLSGTISIAAAKTLTLASNHANGAAGANVISGVISGAGNLALTAGTSTTTGTRRVELSGANTLTGAISVTNSTFTGTLELILSPATAASTASGIALSSTEFQKSKLVVGIGALTLNGLTSADQWSSVGTKDDITLHTLTLADANNGTFAGKITGNLAINKTGAGIWTLSGANSYTGGTTIAGGQISLAHLNALGTTGTVSLTGGALSFDVAHFNRDVTVASGANTLTGAQSASYTGTITLASTGTNSLNLDGKAFGMKINATGGTSTLMGAAWFAGDLSVSAGTLILGSALDAGSAIALSGGAELNVNSQALARDLIVSGTGTLSNNVSYTGSITLGDNTTLTVSALALGANQNLTLGLESKITGNLALNGGSLLFDLDTNEPKSLDSLAVSGNLTATNPGASSFKLNFTGGIKAGDTYQLLTYTGTALTQEALKQFGVTLNVGRTQVSLTGGTTGASNTITVAIGNTESLVWRGATGTGTSTWQTEVITVDVDANAPWSVNGEVTANDNHFHATDAVIFDGSGIGEVKISEEVAPSTVTVSAGSYQFVNADANSGISGNGSLAVSGTAELKINSANAKWSGPVLLNGGSLTLGATGALGSGVLTYNSGVLVIAAGASHSLTGTNFKLAKSKTELGVSVDGSLTLSGVTAELKTLNLLATNGSAGSLSLADQAGSFTVNVETGAKLSLQDAAAHTGVTNIEGTLSTKGNVGGTLNLNAGGKLNLTSGELSNMIHVAGAATLNREAGTWKNLNLKQGSSLTYQVNGVGASLSVTPGQILTANFGSQLNGVLDLAGGILKIGNEGLTSDIQQTVLNLNGGSLTTSSQSVIDMSGLSITKKGNYSFTVVENANTLFNLNFLSLTYQGAGMNLVGAPVLVKENGALVLTFEVAASLTWNGTDLGSIWTTDQSVTNWLKEGDDNQSVASAFGTNDFVVFNDDATYTTVQVVGQTTIGTLKPMSMVVSGTKAYTFEGAGNIVASGSLAYSSTGDLIFKNAGLNEFLSGIQIGTGAGTLKLQGSASLKGDLTVGSKLEIQSSAVSQFSNVSGAGDILIDGTGGATLSSRAVGDYTGIVTIQKGSLTNSNTLKSKGLNIAASGDVVLTGVNTSHVLSLNTSVAGAQITGLTGTITLANGTFALSEATSDRAVVSFTNGSGSLNLGTLELDLKGGLAFLDDTLTHDFVLTNGILGSTLHQMDNMGKYKNITFTAYQGDPDTYAVMSIKGGTVTIGGTKAYENFVLDVNNQWSPHIASTESANFTSAQFKTFANTDFASVTIDGRLGLTGTDAFLLNHLAGDSTGKIFVTDGAAVTLDATGAHPLKKENVYQGVFSAGKSDVTVTTDADTSQSLLGSNYMLTLTLSANSNLTLGGYTKIDGKEVAGAGGTITRQALTLGDGSDLTLAAGSFTEVNGNVTIGDQASLTGDGVLSILAGNKLVIGADAIVNGKFVLEVDASSGDTGSIDVGTAKITLGGITGGGFVNANTGSEITLNVSGEEVFNGTLSGSGTEGATQTGHIVKTGAGTQVLAGKTDKFNLYNLAVRDGALTLKGSATDYDNLVVGATGGGKAARTRMVAGKGYMNVENKITAKNLTVNENGILTIGSASGAAASMTITETASFISGAKMEVFVMGGDTPLLYANEITGLANLSQVTLNASSYWQANLDVILFESKEEISGKLNANNVILSGFGDKNIIYSDDNKTITISAHRGLDDNPFKNAMTGASQNANAGMDIIWAANVRAGESGKNLTSDSKLAGVFNSMVFLGSGTEASNRLMAAVAGASVTALAGSQRDDFRQQQDWIRNRTTGMGISPDYVHEDLPYVNGWIQANGGTTRISQDGDEAGYNLNTFGGTFGFDVDLSAKTTWGFAFTANYNKLTASSAENARGHNDAYYANVFLRTQNKRWANTFILTGGWNDASLDRTVTGAFVNYTAKGSTSGSSIGAMYETTYDYVLNENKTSIFQPLLNLSFANSSMDAYTEEGAGNAGLKVEETKGTYGTIAVGARLLGSVGQSLFGRTSLGELRLQVAQDIGDDTNTAKVGLGGIQREVIGTKVGKTALQFGAGLSIPVSDAGGSIYFDVNTDFRSNATSVNGNIGYRMNF